jgi:hypothetical protein
MARGRGPRARFSEDKVSKTSLSRVFRLSRVCPASCPAFNCFALNTVPRVTGLFLLKDATAQNHTDVRKVVWGYLGKHAGQRGTRDKNAVPNTGEYYVKAAS